MTDHSVTDLSFGHPGDAHYDIEGQRWVFSGKSGDVQHIRQALPFRECLPPSIPHAPEEDGKRLDSDKARLERLLKQYPEVVPAEEIASNLSKSGTLTQPELLDDSETLLAVGRAASNGNFSPVLALPCGQLGHVLRLIRLQTQTYGYDGQQKITISSFDLDLSDQAYWMGVGGTIQQIIFSDDEKEASNWLAVRQISGTTIFRPAFGQLQPASIPSGYPRIYPPSRLSANPVAFVTAEKTQLRHHVDMSFNPWYSRQFILIDAWGYWYIWSIERQRTTSSYAPVEEKRGSIDDDYPIKPILGPSTANDRDGWYRALWVCDINTIVICSRRSIVPFDLYSRPTRLHSIEFPMSSSDLIVDIKRSLKMRSHLFVLTTSRIYWIEITPTGEMTPAGARILLSYRHFRQMSDTSLRLVVVEDDIVSVMITSRKSTLVNIYGFSTLTGRTEEQTSWQGSFILAPKLGSKKEGSFASLCLKPAPCIFGSGLQLEAIRARFLQVWALTADLALTSSICVLHDATPKETTTHKLLATAPKVELGPSRRNFRSGATHRTPFIVSDNLDDESSEATTPIPPHNYIAFPRGGERKTRRRGRELRSKIDWTRIFKAVFLPIDPACAKSGARLRGVLGESSIMTELLATTHERLQQSKKESSPPITTLFELSNCSGFSEELEEATIILHKFLQSLQDGGDSAPISKLVVLSTSSRPVHYFPSSRESVFPSFLEIYDYITELWIGSLPAKTSATARLSKYNIVRHAAIELCLSSIILSVPVSGRSIVEDDENGSHRLPAKKLGSPMQSTSRARHHPEITLNLSLRPHRPSGPPPSHPPSLSSRATSAASSGSNENPAFSRLRQYAVSIGSRPITGKWDFLPQWVVGDDPTRYSWKMVKDPSALGQERLQPVAATAAPQPTLVPVGRRPDPSQQHSSSQITQSSQSIYKGQTTQAPKKKKRKIAGF